MTTTTLYRPIGAEASCPKCQSNNAMLHNTKKSQWNESTQRLDEVYVCRDCNYTVTNPIIQSLSYIVD